MYINNTQNIFMSPIEEERYICAKDIVFHLFIVGWSAHLNSEAHLCLIVAKVCTMVTSGV